LAKAITLSASNWSNGKIIIYRIIICQKIEKNGENSCDPQNLGTATRVDLSNSGILEFLSNIAEGAYRLESIDLSNNFFRAIPRDFFRWNQMLTTIDLSKNQIKSIRPDIISGLRNLETLDLSNNLLSVLNKKLLRDAVKLKEYISQNFHKK